MIRYILSRHTNCCGSGYRLGIMVACRTDVRLIWRGFRMSMERRNFNKLLLGAVTGILAGCTQVRNVVAKGEATEGDEKHACKGMNECKGQGGCKSGDNGCTGKNSCKGKGGCEVPGP